MKVLFKEEKRIYQSPRRLAISKSEEEINNFIQSYRTYWDEDDKQKEIAENVVTDAESIKQADDSGMEAREENLEVRHVEKSKAQKKTRNKRNSFQKADRPLKIKLEGTPKNNKKKKLTEWQATQCR